MLHVHDFSSFLQGYVASKIPANASLVWRLGISDPDEAGCNALLAALWIRTSTDLYGSSAMWRFHRCPFAHPPLLCPRRAWPHRTTWDKVDMLEEGFAYWRYHRRDQHRVDSLDSSRDIVYANLSEVDWLEA